MKLLFVNACVRSDSRTLLLARHLLSRLAADEVTELPLQHLPLSPLNGQSLARRDRLLAQGRLQDALFDHARQFADADCIVIAAPYWDLGFPALLKVYLEAVTVAGVTFCYDNGRPRGLCRASHLYYLTTAGGPVVADYGYPYVRALAENLYGIQNITRICAENLDLEGADVAGILDTAKRQIDHLTRRD